MAFGRKARRIKLLEDMLREIHTFIEVELHTDAPAGTGWEDYYSIPERKAVALDLDMERHG